MYASRRSATKRPILLLYIPNLNLISSDHAIRKQRVSPHRLYLEGCWAYFKMVFSACGIKYMSSACSPHYTFSPQWPHSRGDMMRMTLWQSNCWLQVSRGRTEGHKKIYTLQQRDAVKTENLFLPFHWCIFCLIAMVFGSAIGADSNHGSRFKYSYEHVVELWVFCYWISEHLQKNPNMFFWKWYHGILWLENYSTWNGHFSVPYYT